MYDIALYHPFIHFPNDAWVKAAALYWPRLARIRPLGVDVQDSTVVQQLRDQLDFVVDCSNLRRATDKVELTFFNFLDRHLDELLPCYGVRALGLQPPPWSLVVRDDLPALDPRLFRVSPRKMSDPLTQCH